MFYITKKNDVLDAICWEHYGFSAGVVEKILEANPDLAEYGTYLPAGIKINLPIITTPLPENKIQLWD